MLNKFYTPKPKYPHVCKYCRKTFHSNLTRKQFCNNRCRKKLVLGERASSLSTATRGAVSELRVAVDLLERGYEVFRALSPSCSCCDIAILKDGKLLRVECRTGSYLKSGKHYHTTQNIRADVLAVILPDKIIYAPELP